MGCSPLAAGLPQPLSDEETDVLVLSQLLWAEFAEQLALMDCRNVGERVVVMTSAAALEAAGPSTVGLAGY